MVLHLLLASLLLAAAPVVASPATPIVGLPCDGCELALEGMPATPPASVRLAPAGEPGEPLVLTGTLRNASGETQPGVILYAHQTDATGVYPPASPPNRHGRLRAWAMTDASGSYSFRTIRPGTYPRSSNPQHIHLFVIEPGCALYYIDDVLFRDDPLLTPRHLRQASRGRGGPGIVDPVKREGIWEVRRDIVLGLGVPGHPGCARSAPEATR